MFLRDLNNRKS